MSRNYVPWSRRRGNTNKILAERPHITNLANNIRYYSSLDAEIYLGDTFVDEVTSINYSVQQQVLPVYGYNSYAFNDVILGTRLVQGQFSVNFTKSGFINNLNATRVSRRVYGNDLRIKSAFPDGFRQRLNTPLWDNGFDIVVGFGDNDKTTSGIAAKQYSTFMVLDCCQITGSAIQLDYSGNPIQEIYTFIARDIKYNVATEEEKNPANYNGTSDDQQVVVPTDLKLQGSVDLSNKQAIIKIISTASIDLIDCYVSFTDNFDYQSLKSQIELQSDSTQNVSVSATLDRDKTNKLKKEIENNNYSTLRADISIKYRDNSTKDINGSKTRRQNLEFTIVK